MFLVTEGGQAFHYSFTDKRNDYLEEKIIIFNRDKSKRIFSNSIKDKFFHDNVVSSVNTFFEDLNAVKRISKIGSEQKVVCMEIGKFLFDEDPDFFYLFLVMIGDVIFFIGREGVSLAYSLEHIVGAFAGALLFSEEKIYKLIYMINKAFSILLLENKRSLKKSIKSPEKKPSLDDIFFRNDNLKEYSVFMEKVNKSMSKIRNKELHVDIISSKVRGRAESFQILKDYSNDGWFIIKRLKTGDTFDVIRKGKEKELVYG